MAANQAHFPQLHDLLDVLMRQDLGNPAVHPAEGEDGEDVAADGEDQLDEGVEVDSTHHPDEYPVLALYKRAADFQDPMEVLYCTTTSYVVVTTSTRDYLLCGICYMVYAQRTPLAQHRHVDIHRTSTYTESLRYLCAKCKNRLFTIRPVDACILCNNGDKCDDVEDEEDDL